MKNLLILFSLITFYSCKKEVPPSNALEGKWEMTDYVAMLPVSPALNSGDIIWEFKGQLNITNNVSVQYPFLEKTNAHSYQVKNNTILVLGNTYTYEITGTPSVLILTDSAVVTGAPYRTFIKIGN